MLCCFLKLFEMFQNGTQGVSDTNSSSRILTAMILLKKTAKTGIVAPFRIAVKLPKTMKGHSLLL